MFFLQGMMSDSTALDPTGNLTYADTVKIANAIFDHLNLVRGVLEDGTFDTTIPDWVDDITLLNVYFNNSIDGGTLNQLIGNVAYLEVQRQEQGATDWVTLTRIYKNTTTQQIQSEFTMYDTYNENGVQYNYQIVPVDTQGNSGYALQSDIVSTFVGAYIADASNIFKITNEYTLNKQRNQKNAVYEPLGTKYPFVTYNAATNYDSGSFTAVLLAPTSQSETASFIDRRAQVNLEKKFNDWLTNGRPKILKDFNGMLKVVTIIDAVQNSYYKELGNGIASTACTFVEVGEMSNEYLSALNMANFPLYTNN